MNQDERCEAYKEWMQNFLFSFLHYPPIKEGTKDGSIGKAKRQAQCIEEEEQYRERQIFIKPHSSFDLKM
jgi:hypothetical protein